MFLKNDGDKIGHKNSRRDMSPVSAAYKYTTPMSECTRMSSTGVNETGPAEKQDTRPNHASVFINVIWPGGERHFLGR